MAYSILRLPEVIGRTGLSRSTIYTRIAKGLWPKQIHLGERAVGWLDHEIDSLNFAWAAGKSSDQIRELVSKLEGLRQEADPNDAS